MFNCVIRKHVWEVENKMRSGILALIQVAQNRRGCGNQVRLISCVCCLWFIRYLTPRDTRTPPLPRTVRSQVDSVLFCCWTMCGNVRIHFQNKQNDLKLQCLDLGLGFFLFFVFFVPNCIDLLLSSPQKSLPPKISVDFFFKLQVNYLATSTTHGLLGNFIRVKLLSSVSLLA